MRRAPLIALFAPGFALVGGCAAIIGASFDDAGLAVDASDASDGGVVFPEGSADVSKPPFDPMSINGLVFWIDATRGVDTAGDAGSGPVTRWHDLSTFARDAVPTGVAMTNAPALVPGSLNGLPVVHFTQSQLDLLETKFTGPGTPNLTMFLVARGYPQSAIRFQSASNMYPFVLFPIDVNQDAAAPSFVVLVGTPAQTYTTLHARLDGGAALASVTWSSNGTAATYDDGELVEQRVDLDPTMPSGQTLYVGGVLPLLGGASAPIPFMNGDLAEALIYGAALSDTDRAAVEAYLRAKWGIFP